MKVAVCDDELQVLDELSSFLKQYCERLKEMFWFIPFMCPRKSSNDLSSTSTLSPILKRIGNNLPLT